MKATFHKSCSCRACKRGRNAYSRKLNERKFRRNANMALHNVSKDDDVVIAPISSPYTD